MAEMYGHSVVSIEDSEYPQRLNLLGKPPKEIFVRGILPPALQLPSWDMLPKRKKTLPVVAIVGARRASRAGRDIASRLGADLAGAGAVILSGGALGIDASAHEGALASGGTTVVVLPSSIHRPLPRTNAALFDRILKKGGAWVSEYGSEQKGKSPFCARNRIIAAFCDVLVVVEAGFRSGTSYTVRHAKELGRQIGALPWQVGDSRGHGCLRIFRDGGQVITSAKDVYRILDIPFPKPKGLLERPFMGGIVQSSEVSQIFDVVQVRQCVSIEELSYTLKLPISRVSRLMVQLELSGCVTQSPPGRYIRVSLG